MEVDTTWQGSCEDCWAWVFHDDGTGHCALQSVKCATSILQHGTPLRFIHRLEVMAVEEQRAKEGKFGNFD